MRVIINFIKKEAVFCAAAILAVISMFWIHPSAEYSGYVDYRVLALLWCLMVVVAGMKAAGIFDRLIQIMTGSIHSVKALELILVMLCFVLSMVITNDVALITFVPFTIVLLHRIGREKHIIYILVLQTIAANLGSMVTPIGNPQNLYLYTTFNIGIKEFITTLLPYTIAALVMLVVAVVVVPSGVDRRVKAADNEAKVRIQGGWRLAVILVLLLVCIACVLKILDYRVMLGITIVEICVVNWRLVAKADYMLLLTFVMFFIFVGNVRQIPAVHDYLARIITGNEILVSAGASQIISNVPAAVLLSGFTDNVGGLLVGTNIGGLGTLIASMASLISYRLYGAAEKNKGRYILVFTGMNVLFLAIMLAIAYII